MSHLFESLSIEVQKFVKKFKYTRVIICKVPQTGVMGPVWLSKLVTKSKVKMKKFTRTNWNQNGLNICI
jgi:hypothetical protein